MEQSAKFNCRKCGKEFLVIAQEQAFYKQKGIPMPFACPECRRGRRQGLRNKRKLYARECGKCGVMLESTYPPDSPYTIYCEKCYFAEF
ncbi:zinc-ribbon domain containing protein [Candidatus Peregrinibacteria bacterium]|nr:zinc-ribbon domain containing protein [Candidatus Peregrinibacteria bacterium]